MIGPGLATALAAASLAVSSLHQAPPAAQSAEERYLAGREAVSRRSYDDLRDALAHFRAALAHDSGHAPALAGMADAYALLGEYASAERAAVAALELDDQLAAAHASLAFVRMHHHWDWPGAERAFNRALELDPGYPTAHHWHAIFLEVTGRNAQAIAAAKAALELEPASETFAMGLGYRLFWARRYKEAGEQFQRVLARDPGRVSGHYFLGRSLAEQGRFRKGLEALEAARRLSPRSLNIFGALGYLHARAGRRTEAQRHLRELEARFSQGYPLATHVAAIHTASKDFEAALRWLQTAYETREGPLLWLAVDPRFDPLRGDARLEALLKAMELPAAGDDESKHRPRSN